VGLKNSNRDKGKGEGSKDKSSTLNILSHREDHRGGREARTRGVVVCQGDVN